MEELQENWLESQAWGEHKGLWMEAKESRRLLKQTSKGVGGVLESGRGRAATRRPRCWRERGGSKKKVGVKIHDKGFYESGGVIYTNDDFTDDKIHRVQESSSQKSTTPFLHSLLFTALARGWSRAPEPLRSLTKCS